MLTFIGANLLSWRYLSRHSKLIMQNSSGQTQLSRSGSSQQTGRYLVWWQLLLTLTTRPELSRVGLGYFLGKSGDLSSQKPCVFVPIPYEQKFAWCRGSVPYAMSYTYPRTLKCPRLGTWFRCLFWVDLLFLCTFFVQLSLTWISLLFMASRNPPN